MKKVENFPNDLGAFTSAGEGGLRGLQGPRFHPSFCFSEVATGRQIGFLRCLGALFFKLLEEPRPKSGYEIPCVY